MTLNQIRTTTLKICWMIARSEVGSSKGPRKVSISILLKLWPRIRQQLGLMLSLLRQSSLTNKDSRRRQNSHQRQLPHLPRCNNNLKLFSKPNNQFLWQPHHVICSKASVTVMKIRVDQLWQWIMMGVLELLQTSPSSIRVWSRQRANLITKRLRICQWSVAIKPISWTRQIWISSEMEEWLWNSSSL